MTQKNKEQQEDPDMTPLQKLRALSKSGITRYEATPEELSNFKAKELAKEEEEYDPLNNRSNENLIDLIEKGANVFDDGVNAFKSWIPFLDADKTTELEPTELESTELEPINVAIPYVKPVDKQTEILFKPPAIYPNVLDSNEAIHGRLWGRAFHTEAEYDEIKQADYVDDVRQFLVPNSNYVNTMVPILNKVVPAFAGDSGVKGDILYRAMLEIGAHESQGATDLYNRKSHASGVFQTLTSTVRDTAKDSGYYGPKAQELTGKSRQEVANMTAVQIQNWMQTDFTANAVFGAIELIKLAKGLQVRGEGDYLLQLTGTTDETNYNEAII